MSERERESARERERYSQREREIGRDCTLICRERERERDWTLMPDVQRIMILCTVESGVYSVKSLLLSAHSCHLQ